MDARTRDRLTELGYLPGDSLTVRQYTMSGSAWEGYVPVFQGEPFQVGQDKVEFARFGRAIWVTLILKWRKGKSFSLLHKHGNPHNEITHPTGA